MNTNAVAAAAGGTRGRTRRAARDSTASSSSTASAAASGGAAGGSRHGGRNSRVSRGSVDDDSDDPESELLAAVNAEYVSPFSLYSGRVFSDVFFSLSLLLSSPDHGYCLAIACCYSYLYACACDFHLIKEDRGVMT